MKAYVVKWVVILALLILNSGCGGEEPSESTSKEVVAAAVASEEPKTCSAEEKESEDGESVLSAPDENEKKLSELRVSYAALVDEFNRMAGEHAYLKSEIERLRAELAQAHQTGE